MPKSSCFIVLLFLLVSCITIDEPGDGVDQDLLAAVVASNFIKTGDVIACASGSENANEIIAYVYPRPGASEVRYFETETTALDENDYSNYREVLLNPEDFFNGYLLKFRRSATNEKWIILTFLEQDTLRLSNPIRLKHHSQNTVFSDEVMIDLNTPTMPLFSWDTLASPEDTIYFQIVSDGNDDLLSGTYTTDTFFQYYNTENVVLNITRELPPDLVFGSNYRFTLMGVSKDNWVNVLAQKTFDVE